MYASVFAYPWDVMDESPQAFCTAVRERLGANCVSLAVSYHADKVILPHNPRRKVYYPEDGALYFRPDPTAFAGLTIQPHVGALARKEDILDTLCGVTNSADLGVMAWVVCLHNTRLGETYPQYAPRNAFGDPAITYLCPAQPAMRAYVSALVADLARRYPLRAIQLEAAHHMPFVHGFHHEMQQIKLTPALQVLLGLCFCDACLELAREAGVDGARVRRYVAGEIERLFAAEDGEPEESAWLFDYWRDRLDGEMGRYLVLRVESVSRLLIEVRQAVHAVSTVPVHVLEESCSIAPAHIPALDLAWQLGMEVPPPAGAADGMTVLGYFAGVERFSHELEAYRSRIPAAIPLEVALRPCVPDCASADELAAKVAHCVTLGVAGLSFYNYGMMPEPNMTWVHDALQAVTTL